MGYATTTIDIPPADADRIAAEASASRDCPTFESRMVSEAVELWRILYADRFSVEQAGAGMLLPISSERAAQLWRYEQADTAFQHSPVQPTADDDDVTETTTTARIPVTAERLALLRLRFARRRGGEPILLDVDWLSELRREHGESLVAARVLDLPAPRKAVARTTPGTMKTVYEIVEGRRVLTLRTTLARARAAAIELVNEDPAIGTLTIRAAVHRYDDELGEPTSDLVVVERPVPENTTVPVELIFETVRDGAKPAVWRVTFAYHL